MNDIEKICVKKLPTYCKKCGNVIDDNTKICTGCGKKYFNFKRLFNNNVLFVSCIIIFLLCFLGYTFYQVNTVKQFKDKLNKANEENSIQSIKNMELIAQNNEERKTIAKLEDDISYKDALIENSVKESQELKAYQQCFAFITDTGKKYHKRSCSHIKNRNIYYDTIVDLQNQGYTPCKDCYP